MISVLLATSTESPPEPLQTDLGTAGFHWLGAVTWHNLVREVLQRPPDLVVSWEAYPAPEVFEALKALQAAQPLPVLLFTDSPDVEQLELGIAAGVSCHVVNGYAAGRLRPLVHLALARFRHQQGLRRELGDLSERFEERKLVDRAKGVLMRARQIAEDEAFRMLRVASMHTNQRVGQVSQQVIDAARYAEAVNRAGQIRMLGQQLVKHAALRALSNDPQADAQRIGQLLDQGDRNLDALGKRLSTATYGDLIEAVCRPWAELKAALLDDRTGPASRARKPRSAQPPAEQLATLDRLAEDLLLQAERLTSQLEHAMLATPLRVINLSGRQRMLSQRLAKQTLLATVLRGEAADAYRRDAAATEASFDLALNELDAMPLSSREIRADLAEARVLWARMLAASARAGRSDGRDELRDVSESMLTLFERLTERYEHSLQMLLG